MSNWKANRNYWKVTDEHGNVISYVIEVEGREVKVSEEVFRCYAKGDRRERYILQDQKKGRILSLEQMTQDEVREDFVGIPSAPSCLDILVEQEDETDWEAKKQKILPALLELSDRDRELIMMLFYDGVSTRQAAIRFSISQKRIRAWRDRVLSDLKKIFAKIS